LKFRRLLMLMTVVLVGCGDQSEKPAAEPSPTEEAAADASSEVAPGAEVIEVNLEAADAAKLSEVIENNRGKVVLVDYWATW